MVEQTVGWALHALEPDEEFEVVEHLPGCAECRRTAAEVADVTTGLATALPQYEPPPRLRESIVEQARRTPQVGRGAGERPVPGDRLGPPPQAPRHARRQPGPPADPASGRFPPPAAVPPPVPAGPPRPEPVAGPRQGPAPGPGPSRPGRPDGGAGSGPGRAGRKPRRAGRVLVAALAALAVVVGGGVVLTEFQSMRAERDASIAQARQMEGVLTALAQPGTSHAFLAPEAGEPAVAAVLVHDGGREIVPMGLEPNQVDAQTYVLWGLEADGTPRALGTFDVRSGTVGPLSVASVDREAFGAYAVSLEHGREAPSEPTAVVAAGQVGT
ncbi:anti-sigma factor [Pseudonocardia sp. NPDC046786]|uniref:anti-sigma factor n=1 Tax=Pseudonocardia sp. NPDC046786 TaxID=3155471 RepID=UPI00340B5E34